MRKSLNALNSSNPETHKSHHIYKCVSSVSRLVPSGRLGTQKNPTVINGNATTQIKIAQYISLFKFYQVSN